MTMGMDHTLYISLTSESEKAISRLASPWDDNCKQLGEKTKSTNLQPEIRKWLKKRWETMYKLNFTLRNDP